MYSLPGPLDTVVEVFLSVAMAGGFVLGVGILLVLLGFGVHWAWCRMFPARKVYPQPARTQTVVPRPVRLEVNAREAFDRTTGVFPPFDPRSFQFLQWIRQEWRRATEDEEGTGDIKMRHAFYVECARMRFDEIIAEGGMSREEADGRMRSLRSTLANAEQPPENAVM